MNVYIIIYEIPYCYSEIEKIFLSKEKAENYLNHKYVKTTENNTWMNDSGDYYEILEKKISE